ncbi:protein IMPAIRED IN BABA-INDUCED STERILITY 1-like [Impatiens glandulifera]|uniref:protein IMPAIRED IN BABA-INDUCED STERILITY 1-like n=1 Tax=Impatiens glandulifera TaxID=253017 RepID=UPI001FB183DB|nr:protein IMPAIRED IN BABA-INDUCED STERILITY 1-like [Impatiens glandulifera]
MGCVSSKWAASPSPPPSHINSGGAALALRKHHRRSSSRSSSSSRKKGSSAFHKRGEFVELEGIKEEPEDDDEEEVQELKKAVELLESVPRSREIVLKSKSLKNVGVVNIERRPSFGLRFGRQTQAEQISAGWPCWLSAVAGEAIDGWLPLKSDLYEKMDKIGQGTYSNVYRARNKETGGMFALKKVRFDAFQPESVKFMAREIVILRKLNHPNVMKLEGLIANRLSSSIYLVFEYMEHDLSGLLSCPDIKFTDAQIKCYMQQLLRGVEHCHSRGIMHRDIKTSNILVNNEGVLKITDFGLANNISEQRQDLTSRVVTLWYRPPELLLGSTSYGGSIDLWSVGCVFAELFIGRPILKGRTEVEQLHKIFKLCGSPPEDYWTKSKLPLASMFKPQQPYTSTLEEKCIQFPQSAVSLLQTLLSVDPIDRESAASALDSEYFKVKPFASIPSMLPKYPPNKEMTAKIREEWKRKAAHVRSRAGERFYQQDQREELKSYDTRSEVSQVSDVSEADSVRSVPLAQSSSFNMTRLLREEESIFSRKLQQQEEGHNKMVRAPFSGPILYQAERF